MRVTASLLTGGDPISLLISCFAWNSLMSNEPILVILDNVLRQQLGKHGLANPRAAQEQEHQRLGGIEPEQSRSKKGKSARKESASEQTIDWASKAASVISLTIHSLVV